MPRLLPEIKSLLCRFWPVVLVVWAFGVFVAHAAVSEWELTWAGRDGDLYFACLLLFASWLVGFAGVRVERRPTLNQETGMVELSLEHRGWGHDPVAAHEDAASWMRQLDAAATFVLLAFCLPAFLVFVALLAVQSFPSGSVEQIGCALVVIPAPALLGVALGLSSSRFSDWLPGPLMALTAFVFSLLQRDLLRGRWDRILQRGMEAGAGLLNWIDSLRHAAFMAVVVLALAAVLWMMLARRRGPGQIALWQPVVLGFVLGAVHEGQLQSSRATRELRFQAESAPAALASVWTSKTALAPSWTSGLRIRGVGFQFKVPAGAFDAREIWHLSIEEPKLQDVLNDNRSLPISRGDMMVMEVTDPQAANEASASGRDRILELQLRETIIASSELRLTGVLKALRFLPVATVGGAETREFAVDALRVLAGPVSVSSSMVVDNVKTRHWQPRRPIGGRPEGAELLLVSLRWNDAPLDRNRLLWIVHGHPDDSTRQVEAAFFRHSRPRQEFEFPARGVFSGDSAELTRIYGKLIGVWEIPVDLLLGVK